MKLNVNSVNSPLLLRQEIPATHTQGTEGWGGSEPDPALPGYYDGRGREMDWAGDKRRAFETCLSSCFWCCCFWTLSVSCVKLIKIFTPQHFVSNYTWCGRRSQVSEGKGKWTKEPTNEWHNHFLSYLLDTRQSQKVSQQVSQSDNDVARKEGKLQRQSDISDGVVCYPCCSFKLRCATGGLIPSPRCRASWQKLKAEAGSKL